MNVKCDLLRGMPIEFYCFVCKRCVFFKNGVCHAELDSVESE